MTKPLDYVKLRAILQASEEELELRRESRKLFTQLDKGAGHVIFAEVGQTHLIVVGSALSGGLAHGAA